MRQHNNCQLRAVGGKVFDRSPLISITFGLCMGTNLNVPNFTRYVPTLLILRMCNYTVKKGCGNPFANISDNLL